MSASSLKKATLSTLAVGALAVLGMTATASADQVRIGTLECAVSPGIGLIITSTRSLDCIFRPSHGRIERYRGQVSRIGLDIGFTDPGQLAWAVFAATSHAYRHGALVGQYGGISAQATLVVGLGANALLGGSDRSFALQPISVEAQTGFNLAAGIAGLTLF